MNRRDLIVKGFKSLVLAGVLPQFSACIRSELEKDYLFSLNENDFNFVQLNLYGGPVRWMFDNFLKPKDENEFVPTKMVGGRFKNSDGDVELNFIKRYGYNVPEFWGLKSKSGLEHSSLLENMITIRGVNINVSGHPLGIIKTVRPDSTKPSLQGVISDNSKSPLPSVIFGSNPATRSYFSNERGGLQVPLNESNLLKQILNPFVMAEEKSLFGKKNKKDKIIKSVLENLDGVYGSEDKYLKELRGSLDLFIDNLDPYLEEYASVLEKYEKLISENTKEFDGLSIDKLKLRELNTSNLKEIEKEESWGRYKIDYQTYLRGSNLEEMLASADMGHIPHQFACTEFLLKRGLSNSLMLSTPNEMGSFLYGCNNTGNISQKSFEKKKIIPAKEKSISIQMDSHHTGTVLQTAASFMFYRGLVPCLDRFKNELKKVKTKEGKTLFDKTLIHICSEFERIPRDDEAGSEHNHSSHTSSFLSGSIKKFKVCGNIKTGNKELGTIGTSANVDHFKREIFAKDIYQSVCDIVGVKSPVPRAKGLLKWEGDEIIPTFDELKNVKGES
ncbi:MAG: hypothetical protein KC493_14440 [Bacteriovoracaceae bacterium]|nr:hypothetical protein [Bacteriovoracaceae bacterium]